MFNFSIIKKYLLFIFPVFLILFFVNAEKIDAATINISSEMVEIGRGQQIEVSVYLDTDSEVINALEGSIDIPEALGMVEVRTGNSFISLWTEKPNMDNGTLSFAGIVPGGFRAVNGFLFSLILDAQSLSENVIISGQNIAVFLHDGKGSKVVSESNDLALNIRRDIPVVSLIKDQGDREAPEIFTPIVTKNPALFDGDYFLVFSAQDKHSGIQQYEIRESKWPVLNKTKGIWGIASSPHRLEDQTRESFIYIRAIDHSGNIRVVSLAPEKTSGYRILIILILGLLVIVLSVRSYFLRKKHDELL